MLVVEGLVRIQPPRIHVRPDAGGQPIGAHHAIFAPIKPAEQKPRLARRDRHPWPALTITSIANLGLRLDYGLFKDNTHWFLRYKWSCIVGSTVKDWLRLIFLLRQLSEQHRFVGLERGDPTLALVRIAGVAGTRIPIPAAVPAGAIVAGAALEQILHIPQAPRQPGRAMPRLLEGAGPELVERVVGSPCPGVRILAERSQTMPVDSARN